MIQPLIYLAVAISMGAGLYVTAQLVANFEALRNS
jgi:hypothetical protein